jgi:hypothetical protein
MVPLAQLVPLVPLIPASRAKQSLRTAPPPPPPPPIVPLAQLVPLVPLIPDSHTKQSVRTAPPPVPPPIVPLAQLVPLVPLIPLNWPPAPPPSGSSEPSENLTETAHSDMPDVPAVTPSVVEAPSSKLEPKGSSDIPAGAAVEVEYDGKLSTKSLRSSRRIKHTSADLQRSILPGGRFAPLTRSAVRTNMVAEDTEPAQKDTAAEDSDPAQKETAVEDSERAQKDKTDVAVAAIDAKWNEKASPARARPPTRLQMSLSCSRLSAAALAIVDANSMAEATTRAAVAARRGTNGKSSSRLSAAALAIVDANSMAESTTRAAVAARRGMNGKRGNKRKRQHVPAIDTDLESGIAESGVAGADVADQILGVESKDDDQDRHQDATSAKARVGPRSKRGGALANQRRPPRHAKRAKSSEDTVDNAATSVVVIADDKRSHAQGPKSSEDTVDNAAATDVVIAVDNRTRNFTGGEHGHGHRGCHRELTEAERKRTGNRFCKRTAGGAPSKPTLGMCVCFVRALCLYCDKCCKLGANNGPCGKQQHPDRKSRAAAAPPSTRSSSSSKCKRQG